MMKPTQEIKEKKIILVSTTAYSSKYEGLLNLFLEKQIELFCAVGKDCEKWEDAIDWLYVENKKDNNYHITTTCHPDETLDEVKEFAELFIVKSNDTKVQVIEI